MPCWAWRCPAQVKLRVLVRTDMKLTSKACSARASKFLRNASCCPLAALRYDVTFFFIKCFCEQQPHICPNNEGDSGRGSDQRFTAAQKTKKPSGRPKQILVNTTLGGLNPVIHDDLTCLP